MMTTRSPAPRLGGDRPDDRVDVREAPGARCRRARGRRRAAPPTAARPRAASTGTPARASTSSAPARERPREVVLEHAPARRRRSRLEDAPRCGGRDAPRARPAASRESPSDGGRSRRRPSRPASTPRNSSRRLTPSNAASARAQARRARAPSACPTAIAASALRTLWAPKSGTSNSPNGSPRSVTSNRQIGCPSARRRGLPVRVGGDAERLDRQRACAASRTASGLSAPMSSRPRRGTSFTSRRNASAPPRSRHRCPRGRTRRC